jgi:hypothetical protein
MAAAWAGVFKPPVVPPHFFGAIEQINPVKSGEQGLISVFSHSNGTQREARSGSTYYKLSSTLSDRFGGI